MESEPDIQLRKVENLAEDDSDIQNGRLFWTSESYDAYRMKCDILGVEPIFSRDEFDSVRGGLKLYSELSDAKI